MALELAAEATAGIPCRALQAAGVIFGKRQTQALLLAQIAHEGSFFYFQLAFVSS